MGSSLWVAAVVSGRLQVPATLHPGGREQLRAVFTWMGPPHAGEVLVSPKAAPPSVWLSVGS